MPKKVYICKANNLSCKEVGFLLQREIKIKSSCGNYNKLQSQTIMANVKIGQRGKAGPIDLKSALDDVINRYNRFYKMLYDYDAGFGHFYHLDNYRKDLIIKPFIELLDCRNLTFRQMYTSGENSYSNKHYDFYVGEVNDSGKRNGIGLYSWEWEKDDDGDTSITYFIGQFENGVRKSGVWYHLSNEDAKIYVDVDNEFRISALNGVYAYSTPSSSSGKTLYSNSPSINYAGLFGCLAIVIAIIVGVIVKSFWIGIVVWFVLSAAVGYIFDTD